MTTLTKVALLVASISVLAFADSVTTSNNLTLFGHVVELDRAVVKLTARFPSQKGIDTRTVPIPRSNVVKIEFNATTFNPGAPPPDFGTGETGRGASRDIVVLRGGKEKNCDGVLIDEQKVHCGRQEWDRALVVRVTLGR